MAFARLATNVRFDAKNGHEPIKIVVSRLSDVGYQTMMQKTYFWKYQGNTRNYPGFHLSLNKEAADTITERLRSRLSMQMQRSVSFDLKVPTDDVLCVPNNRNHKAHSKDRLEISIGFDAKTEHLQIEETSDAFDVELSPSKTNELLDGIEGLMMGQNDYAIWGEDSQGNRTCIWFW